MKSATTTYPRNLLLSFSLLMLALLLPACSAQPKVVMVSDPLEGEIDKTAFAKAIGGKWRNKGSYQSKPNPDGSRDTLEWDEVYVFTFAPTKTAHGTYKWSKKDTDSGKVETNTDSGTWVVLTDPEKDKTNAWVAAVNIKSNKPGLDLSLAGPELREQLERSSEKRITLSKSTLVTHRHGDGFKFEDFDGSYVRE